jgi:hypothetical protein
MIQHLETNLLVASKSLAEVTVSRQSEADRISAFFSLFTLATFLFLGNQIFKADKKTG